MSVPTVNPELERVFSQICSSLQRDKIIFETDCHPENEGSYGITTVTNGYINAGFLAWSDMTQSVQMACFENDWVKRIEMEGLDQKDAQVAWIAPDIPTFLLFLTGKTREIMQKIREKKTREAFGGEN